MTETALQKPTRTASQQARRDGIVASALALLEEREYDRIQMRDVAEASGVALATLYRYFPSKEQLFAHALLEWHRSFESAVATRRTRGTSAERLTTVLRRAATAFERHPHYFRLITALENVVDPAVQEPFGEFSRRFRLVIDEALGRVDPGDRDLIAAVLMSLLSSELRSWSTGGKPMPAVQRRLADAVELVFRVPATVSQPGA